MIIDTHCHLDSNSYSDLGPILKKMTNNIMIASGTNLKDSKEIINLCDQYKNIYGIIGFHPDEIATYDEKAYQFLKENITQPKIVAIGEIGLDYFHNKENKERQKEIFIQLLKLANQYKKPIVIHSRDAIEDTYQILKKYLNGNKAVLHCYSGSVEMAKKFVQLGVKFGIGGVVTFKNAETLKKVVEEISINDILLETDSPFLTPEPFRGEKNEPYNVIYIAKKIAEIKSINVEQVLEITSQNAIEQFDLMT